MLRAALIFLSVFVLGGCVETNVKPNANPLQAQVDRVRQARLAREHAMQEAWIGKSIEQVEATLGEPRMIMDIPGAARSSVVLYGVLDLASNCIDAFRVAHGEVPTVTEYFCR